MRRILHGIGLFLAVVCICQLCACGSTSWRKGGVPGSKPYTVRGKTYYPLKSAHGFVEEGVASWYGPGFHGKTTASGERFNQYALTAAHKILPLDTKVRVTNLSNGRSLIVRINDRGPFVDDRVIDLSKACAQRLGVIGKGTARVRIQSLTGESVFNRSALVEGRVLAKFNCGDRRSAASVGFANGIGLAGVESAEIGVFGVELGAGLTVPLGSEAGSIFVDASYELYSEYSNLNASVGYRLSF